MLDAYIAVAANIAFLAVLGVALLGLAGWCFEGLYRQISGMTIHHRVAAWLDNHAAPEWRLAHRLRSVQLAFITAVLGGMWTAVPAFQSAVSPIHFAELCVSLSVAICFARLTGQKGLPDA